MKEREQQQQTRTVRASVTTDMTFIQTEMARIALNVGGRFAKRLAEATVTVYW